MKALIDRLAPGMEMRVVFVSESGKLNSAQPIKDGKKIALEAEFGWSVDQYVLLMDTSVDLLNLFTVKIP